LTFAVELKKGVRYCRSSWYKANFANTLCATPNIVVIGIEEPDEFGPCGAKGVGEIGLVPTASAVANAFFQFNGERQYELPLRKM